MLPRARQQRFDVLARPAHEFFNMGAQQPLGEWLQQHVNNGRVRLHYHVHEDGKGNGVSMLDLKTDACIVAVLSQDGREVTSVLVDANTREDKAVLMKKVVEAELLKPTPLPVVNWSDPTERHDGRDFELSQLKQLVPDLELRKALDDDAASFPGRHSWHGTSGNLFCVNARSNKISFCCAFDFHTEIVLERRHGRLQLRAYGDATNEHLAWLARGGALAASILEHPPEAVMPMTAKSDSVDIGQPLDLGSQSSVQHSVDAQRYVTYRDETPYHGSLYYHRDGRLDIQVRLPERSMLEVSWTYRLDAAQALRFLEIDGASGANADQIAKRAKNKLDDLASQGIKDLVHRLVERRIDYGFHVTGE